MAASGRSDGDVVGAPDEDHMGGSEGGSCVMRSITSAGASIETRDAGLELDGWSFLAGEAFEDDGSLGVLVFFLDALFFGIYSPSFELRWIMSSVAEVDVCAFDERALARSLVRSAISCEYDGSGGTPAGSVSCMLDGPGRELELCALVGAEVAELRGASSNGSCCELSRLDILAKYAGESFLIGRGLGRPAGFEVGVTTELFECGLVSDGIIL